ncbi:MAG TPA: peptidoglycan-binding protein, partial [Coleofasciculaceae cyanobacterium]
TGYYGPMTEAAVKQFQSARGISTDGIAGSETLAVLGLNSEKPASDQPLTQSDVTPGDDPDISPKAAVGFQQSKITPADEPTVAPESPVGFEQSKLTPADEPAVTSKSPVGFEQSKLTPADEPTVVPESTVTLQKGDRSTQVSTLQKKLQAAGYFNGPITGYYGSLTQGAVMKFQAAKGLTTNGIADSSTLNAIASSNPVESSTGEVPDDPSIAPQQAVPDDPKTFRQSDIVLRRGNRSAEVTSLQKQLQAAGYFNGPITGYYGALTHTAVLEFQKAKGLMADGIAASETLSALASSTGDGSPSSTTTQPTTPPSAFNNEPFIDNLGNVDKPQGESSSPQALEEEAKKKRTPRLGILTFQE